MRHLERRELLISLTALLLGPLASYAQQADKVRRIGFLSLDAADAEAGHVTRALFSDALKRLNYVEGGNLVIEWRWANGARAILPGLAAELVRAQVEIIVARNNQPIEAAMKATKVIPIVMLNGNFPVENAFVASIARPGGNVTGTSYLVSTDIFAKHLQLLKELAPGTDRVAVLREAAAAGAYPPGYAVLDRTATGLGMRLHYFDVRQPDDIAAALRAIAASRIKAMWYPGTPMLRTRSADIMAFLRDHRLASLAVIPTFAEAGGLAHYAPDGRGYYDRTASFVDRILKGARASELPVEESSKYELVINLKTARLLGITVSQSLLLRADRVIE